MKQHFTFRTLLLTVFLGVVGSGGVHAQYCTPMYGTGCSVGDDIDDVILEGDIAPGINNLDVPCAGGYQDFTNLSATLTIGNSYDGNVTTTYTSSSEDVRIWIDFNDNEVFEDGEEIATLEDLSNTSAGLFNFTVPMTALPGTYRMRVRLVWGQTDPSSIDPCNNYTWGECHDYTVNLAAAIACSDPSYSFPTSAESIADPLSICTSGDVDLNIVTSPQMSPAAGVTYQWQISDNATGPWADFGPANNTPAYTGTISASSYFRCIVLCEGAPSGLISDASDQVVVTNPGTATGTDGSRCGPGSVALSATGPAGTTLRWYAEQTGGTPLGIGPNFLTPYITETTDFWVSAGTPPAAGTATIGAGALIPSFDYVTIFSGGWGGYKHQFLIRADELTAMGMTPGSVINTISVDNDNGTATYNGFKVSLKNTTATTMAAFETGVTLALDAGNYTTVVGINTFALDAPFIWDGNNLIIETCWSNNNSSNTYSNLKYDDTPYPSTRYRSMDNSTPDAVCADMAGSSTYSRRPQFIFDFDASCQGPRSSVTATVNSSTSLTIDLDTLICNDVAKPIQVTNPSATYSGYFWTPQDYLFTDASGTTAYTGGDASTIYFRSTVSGPHDIYLMAGDPTVATGCTFADTLSIWVQPGGVAIASQPDTICVLGTSTLSLVPLENYALGSIQWQQSADGSTYTDIAGETGVSYTTEELGFNENTYYRALVSEGVDICAQPDKYIVIANPVIVATRDSFNCGPGSVTLAAETDGNGTAVWYAGPEGGLPLATGQTFVTPYLLETTSFYIASGGGGAMGEETVGDGGNSGSGTYSPFTGGWGGRKHQYLVTADELIAAGIPPGANLNALSFDVTAGSGNLYPGFTISMGMTTVTDLSGGFVNTVTEVRPATDATLSVGVNQFLFDTPFPWDGTSNIVVQTCWSNGTFTNDYGSVTYDFYDDPYTRYASQDNSTPADLCALTGGFTLDSRPQMILGYDNRCESAREEVIAYIRPVPIVDLGDDINNCVDSGTMYVLDAGVQPNSPVFAWDDGSSSQVRAVGESGTYSVNVTNQWGCSDGDTVNIVLRHNPVVELGNDTSVCNGVVVSLDAGTNGIEYFWNTGATTQVIEVNNSGQYNVFVTNEAGCVTLDTVNVIMEGELPSVQGIAIDNNGGYTFTFTAINPQHVIGYEWDFGDGSSLSYADSATHTYATTGNYFVTVKLSSTCGFYMDSTSTHIVGIDQINVDNNSLTVYPNPANDYATVVSRGGLKLEQVAVYNVLGQLIQTVKSDSPAEHRLSLSGLASGVYTLQVQTDKGIVTRKLEIIQ